MHRKAEGVAALWYLMCVETCEVTLLRCFLQVKERMPRVGALLKWIK